MIKVIDETEMPDPVPPDGLVVRVVSFDYITGTRQILRGIHKPLDCVGRQCVIHNPSDHHMRSWPTNWRSGGMLDIKGAHMERICPHGIGHPDPDDAVFQAYFGNDVSVHGCDGCCTTPT